MKQKPYLIFLVGLILGAGVIYLTTLSKTKHVEIVETVEVSENQPQKITPQKATDIENFDFWKLECDKEKTNCNIFQRLTFQQKTADDTTQTVLALNLIIYMAQDEAGKKTPRIRFITPLGLDLTAGLAMRVDEGQEFKMPIQMCNASGCMADYNLGADVLKEMKNGANILVGYRLPNSKPLILKASLKGITAAYDALQR